MDEMKTTVLDIEAAKRAYTLVPQIWRTAIEIDGIISQAPEGCEIGTLVRMRDAMQGFCTEVAHNVDVPAPVGEKVFDLADDPA